MNIQKQQSANIHTDSAQFLDKERIHRKKVQNRTKLDLNVLPRLKPQFMWNICGRTTAAANLLKSSDLLSKISTSNKFLIKTDLPLNTPQFLLMALVAEVQVVEGQLQHLNLVWNKLNFWNYDLACDASSFQKCRTKFWTVVDIN